MYNCFINFAVLSLACKFFAKNIHIFVTVKEILKKYWGYESFRPKQQEIIEAALAGKDVLGILPTGGGKSLCFQIPALMKDGIAIVVTPLISLMKDQVQNLASKGIRALAVHSGMTFHEIDAALDNARFGGYRFLYLSPERLGTEIFVSRLKNMEVTYIVVDEAHCISQWGYDFRPDYLSIASVREYVPSASVIALTATATRKVADDIMEKLAFREPLVYSSGFERPNLSYSVVRKENKAGALLSLCTMDEGSGIVYVRERKAARETASFLVSQGVSADFYHAGISKQERDARQDAWKRGDVRIMVATNAFGMGIDKPDVRFVCHLDVPESIESYYQEAGRAGRDGLPAAAVMLWNDSDVKRLEAVYRTSFPPLDYVRDIYQKVFIYLGLAYEEGMGQTRCFDIVDFSRHFRLNAAMAYSAVKYIGTAGYWSVTDEIDNPTRIMFSVDRDALYNIQLSDKRMDTFLKALMRTWPGLFSHLVSIDEEYLARLTLDSVHGVKSKLLYLSRNRILVYVPRKRSPLIHFSNERLTPGNLCLSEADYQKRKLAYRERMDAVLEYVRAGENGACGCRSIMLSEYFGQDGVRPCGICDLCRSDVSICT